jgi:undecaprenyl-diphosphatase
MSGRTRQRTGHLEPAQRYGVRSTLLLVASFLVGVPFGLLVLEVSRDGPVTRLDAAVVEALHGPVGDSQIVHSAMVAITTLGRVEVAYGLVAAVSIYLMTHAQKRLLAFVLVTTVLGGILNLAVKMTIGRPRPIFDEPLATALGKSFPSGHTVMATVVYGSILLVFLPALAPRWRPAAVAFVSGLIVMVGFSRLALGVHFPSDVVAGLVLGLAWLAASVAAFELWRVELGKPRSHPLVEGVEPEAGPRLRELTSHSSE